MCDGGFTAPTLLFLTLDFQADYKIHYGTEPLSHQDKITYNPVEVTDHQSQRCHLIRLKSMRFLLKGYILFHVARRVVASQAVAGDSTALDTGNHRPYHYRPAED